MKTEKAEIRVFLASSDELVMERIHIGDLFNDINSILAETPVRVRLLKWEAFDPSFKGNRKQAEYNDQIKRADIFIALFRTRAGEFTKEEAGAAKDLHIQNKKPSALYCFIHDCDKKREFDIDELKADLGTDFINDTFKDIDDLELKVVKILEPRLGACGITVNDTGKFIQIGPVNILRKKTI